MRTLSCRVRLVEVKARVKVRVEHQGTTWTAPRHLQHGLFPGTGPLKPRPPPDSNSLVPFSTLPVVNWTHSHSRSVFPHSSRLSTTSRSSFLVSTRLTKPIAMIPCESYVAFGTPRCHFNAKANTNGRRVSSPACAAYRFSSTSYGWQRRKT